MYTKTYFYDEEEITQNTWIMNKNDFRNNNLRNNQNYIFWKTEEEKIVKIFINQKIMLQLLSYLIFFQKIVYYLFPIIIFIFLISIIYYADKIVTLVMLPAIIFVIIFLFTKIIKKVKIVNVTNFYEYFFTKKYNFFNIIAWLIYIKTWLSIIWNFIYFFPQYSDTIFLLIVSWAFSYDNIFTSLFIIITLFQLLGLSLFGFCYNFLGMYHHSVWKEWFHFFLAKIFKLNFISIFFLPFIFLFVFPVIIISYILSHFSEYSILKLHPKWNMFHNFEPLGNQIYKNDSYLLIKI